MLSIPKEVKKIRTLKTIYKNGTKDITVEDAMMMSEYVSLIVDNGADVTIEIPIKNSNIKKEGQACF